MFYAFGPSLALAGPVGHHILCRYSHHQEIRCPSVFAQSPRDRDEITFPEGQDEKARKISFVTFLVTVTERSPVKVGTRKVLEEGERRTRRHGRRKDGVALQGPVKRLVALGPNANTLGSGAC